MTIDENLKTTFETDGRVWLRNAVSDEDLALFDVAAADQAKAGQRLGRSGPLGKALAPQGSLMKAIRTLDPGAKPVRVVAFNKSEDANWGVPWHQDRVIEVADRQDVEGFGNWTRKSGAWHCEPPQAVLDRMLFVRVHLDDTDQSNGAMEISLGSHAGGIVPSSDAEAEALRHPVEVCEAERGDVLILKMLTLHASKPAMVRSGRRVLRVDFASSELPDPLKWVSLDT
jgi:ectoine hydroxylase-related dioxygenase (phytanoyl-CoA dioxygenase family)